MALILLSYNKRPFKLMSVKIMMPGVSSSSQIDDKNTLLVETNNNTNTETDFTMEDDSFLADTEESEDEEINIHANPTVNSIVVPDFAMDDEFLGDTEGSESEEIIIHANSIVGESATIRESNSATDTDDDLILYTKKSENKEIIIHSNSIEDENPSIEGSDSATDEDLFLGNYGILLSVNGLFNSNSISSASSTTPTPAGSGAQNKG